MQADRLITAMTPLAANLPFASKCCSVGAELLAVYAGNANYITVSIPSAAGVFSCVVSDICADAQTAHFTTG